MQLVHRRNLLAAGGVSAAGAILPGVAAAADRAGVDMAMLDRYIAFLAHEHQMALWQRGCPDFEQLQAARALGFEPVYRSLDWMPDDPEAIALVNSAAPSDRAALVCAAASRV